MFQATASEVLVLKTFLRFSKADSKYIEESEFFGILRSAQNDGNCAQDDDKAATEILNQVQNDDKTATEILNQVQNDVKNAIEGCIAKGFVQKLEKDGKTFYKITEDGFKQI